MNMQVSACFSVDHAPLETAFRRLSLSPLVGALPGRCRWLHSSPWLHDHAGRSSNRTEQAPRVADGCDRLCRAECRCWPGPGASGDVERVGIAARGGGRVEG